jgi:type IV secretory pathway VirB10-like protein
MKTDSDYLWDRTGEPDPEIQQLEEVLGELRYQPRPLEIPAGLHGGRERSFFRRTAPRLAIAATIAMLLLGLGLWLGLQRLQRSQPPQIVKNPETPEVKPNPGAMPAPNEKQNSPFVASSPETERKPIDQPLRHQLNRPLLAQNSNRARKTRLTDQQLTEQQQQEGLAAKDQLMLALRVTSAKLSLAQKKAQSTNAPDLIHNQHKIG